MYIYSKTKNKKKKSKKNSRFPNLSQKERKIFKKKKKSLWSRGIKPLRLLKKKFLWTRGIGLPSDFFKKCPFFFLFLSKISRFFKVFFSKWYMRISWTKLFLNCGV